MEDTAQPVMPAAETDPIADAAQAFKTMVGQPEPLGRDRDNLGRFKPRQQPQQAAQPALKPQEYDHPDTPDDDVDAGDDADEADADAANQDADEGDDEAADEAQPEEPSLPTSWGQEDAEIWDQLPAEAKAKIADREAQRDAAVNAKFQEAANVRKANEAIIIEANTNREQYLRAADDVLAMVEPTLPPATMLDINSVDYDPDSYHLARANYEQAMQTIDQVRQQRDYVLAQHQAAQEQEAQAAFEAVESQFRPKLFDLIPDLSNPEKSGAVLGEVARYAVQNGIPEEVFANPKVAARVSSPEIAMAYKAMQWDKLQAAKGRVTPKGPKAPTPTVKAGVQPTRSSIQHQRYSKDSNRLAKSGSIEDGASVWKHFLKE